jgi:hypothetical protein
MKIIDYQTGKELTDVSIVLSEEELQDLSAYIDKLNHDQRVPCAHLTTLSGSSFGSEVTFAVGSRLGHQLAS